MFNQKSLTKNNLALVESLGKIVKKTRFITELYHQNAIG